MVATKVHERLDLGNDSKAVPYALSSKHWKCIASETFYVRSEVPDNNYLHLGASKKYWLSNWLTTKGRSHMKDKEDRQYMYNISNI